MSDWIEQYSAALTERDAREQAHKSYIDAYTRLADRTAQSTAPAPAPPPETPSSPRPASATSTPIKGKDPAASKAALEQQPNDLLARLRADLTTTQKARSTLQTQLDALTTTLSTLQTAHKATTTQTALLTRQRTDLERRLRDRDEELRGKAQLVTHAQDEMVALGLQLNMAEQRSEKLERENRELVARWMKRVGEEAEKMNVESKWE